MERLDNHDADDGYDYNMVDDGPEDEPTRERRPAYYRQPPLEHGVLNRADFVNDSFTGTTPYIFQRRAGGRRAKIPIDVDADLGRRPNSIEVTDRERSQVVIPKSACINLPWTMPEIDGRHVLQLSYARADEDLEQAFLQRQRVRWHHSDQTTMQLDTFEDFIHRCQSQGTDKGQGGLARRLLKRVRKIAEREFVGGRFLTPLALRYDNQDLSTYTVDKTCIFFSFPYFLVAKPELREHFNKNDPRHPPRTLLQSHYRLNKTVDRDEDQCISLLKDGTIASLINAPYNPKAFWSSHSIDRFVFVPQFWGIIDGLDTLISSGPINGTVLRSSAINITESIPRPLGNTLSLIRILFKYQNRQEDLIYPVAQCNSWFGLLNKQQQIIEFLGDENDKPHPRECRFWFNERRPITISNWTTLLRNSQASEIVNVWMSIALRTNTHSVDVDSPGNPDQVPVVSTFFAWDVLDEFGETNQINVPDRVDSFLKAIYSHVALDTQVMIEAKSKIQVDQYLQTINKKSMAFKLAQELQLMFCLYVPSEHNSVSQPVEMYWGAVFEIVEMFNDEPILNPILKKYLKMVSDIIYHAQRLHHGVYCSRFVQDETTKEWSNKDGIANGTVLLTVIVDAFESILRMIVETLKALRIREEITDDMMGPASKVTGYGKEACELLQLARDQLIKEVDGQNRNDDIGPVITPEAITIALFDRLASGVLHDGALDIILLYDEYLEYLALKVRNEASRRLLQKLNGFKEEVTIIKDVLKEQHNVLSSLRASLDPKSLNTPSITRKLRFNFECKAIDKILTRIQEKITSCDELLERAEIHTIQNVQLVETFQDDNSKAILAFSLATILFLPMSFVTGFFGMNVIGISNTTTTLRQFFTLLVPLTVITAFGVTAVAFKAEDVFFGIARTYRDTRKLWSSEK